MPISRPVSRDTRDFDTTQLHEAGHGRSLHRDYSSHFFRWSFARRHIRPEHNVLDVGCGQDQPLLKILTGGAARSCGNYVGVDLNPLRKPRATSYTLRGNFNIIEQWRELFQYEHAGYDRIVCFEVIEHMKREYGQQLLEVLRALLAHRGQVFLSTPCYDGVRHAANHIHEYTVQELHDAIVDAGFRIIKRFGTFMDIKHIGTRTEQVDSRAIMQVRQALSEYYDNDAISCFFAPLYPDLSRNNLWILEDAGGPTPSREESQPSFEF